MQCTSCGSKWETENSITICPFCGANLMNKELKDNMTISDAIGYIIASNGNDILKNHKLVYSYVLDYVRDREREKKLFRIVCNNGLLSEALKLLSANSQQQEIIIRKAKKMLVDNAFLSEENATNAINTLLVGIGKANLCVMQEEKSEATSKIHTIDNTVSTETVSAKTVSTEKMSLVASSTVEKKQNNDIQYELACNLFEKAKADRNAEKLGQANELFEFLGDYKDSASKSIECNNIILEILYANALNKKNKLSTLKDVYMIERDTASVEEMFSKIGDYKDSKEQAASCYELKQELIYNLALSVMESANRCREQTMYSKAVDLFGKIPDYKDSKEKSKYCSEQLVITHKEYLYKRAIAFSKVDNKFSLEQAIEIFEQLSEWEDSRRLCNECRRKIKKVEKNQKRQDELKAQREQAEQNNRLLKYRRSNGLCQHCGGNFAKKLFRGLVCQNCGRNKDY